MPLLFLSLGVVLVKELLLPSPFSQSPMESPIKVSPFFDSS